MLEWNIGKSKGATKLFTIHTVTKSEQVSHILVCKVEATTKREENTTQFFHVMQSCATPVVAMRM